ncbi:MAG: c-type cytochrome [bacterium]
MKDELLFLKISGAVLTSMLLFFGLPILVNTFMGEGHHAAHGKEVDEKNPAEFAYYVDYTGGNSASTEKEEVKPVSFYLASASASQGERKISLCKSCHTLEKGGANGTGPNLWGVVGRKIASHEGYSYTAAMSSVDGNWTYERLDALLADSGAYMPGTGMAQKIRKPQQRANILAYLATLSDDPVPFPKYEEAAAAATDAAADMAEDMADKAMGEMGEQAAEALDDAHDSVKEAVGGH